MAIYGVHHATEVSKVRQHAHLSAQMVRSEPFGLLNDMGKYRPKGHDMRTLIYQKRGNYAGSRVEESKDKKGGLKND